MDSVINLTKADFVEVLPCVKDDGHRGSRFEVVTITAYLLGIHKKYFEGPDSYYDIDIFNKLEKDKKARIIRNLCMVRTQLLHKFKKVSDAIHYDGKSIMSLSEYIPQEALAQLNDDGISIYTNLKHPRNFLINLNKEINKHINNCRSLYPLWLKWEYLSKIFIMPNGTTEQGSKESQAYFYSMVKCYPYKTYMNWPAKEDGNILYDDKKFVTRLYAWNKDEFKDLNLVSDASDRSKGSIYSLLENSEKCVVVVDCENSDPYSLCAALKSLDANKLQKISKIVLFDDEHASSAWEILESYTGIPVEYNLIKRVTAHKSLTDIKVATRICKEYYSGEADSFLLVSSDSDYWSVIEDISGANFLVMAEREKCGLSFKEALLSHNIPYCFIDSFYAGDAADIKEDALMREFESAFASSIALNINAIMKNALASTRIVMNEDEIKNFIDRKIKKHIDVEVTEDGDVKVLLRNSANKQ